MTQYDALVYLAPWAAGLVMFVVVGGVISRINDAPLVAEKPRPAVELDQIDKCW